MAALDSITTPQRTREDRAIYRAMRLLEGRLREPGEAMSNPGAARQRGGPAKLDRSLSGSLA